MFARKVSLHDTERRPGGDGFRVERHIRRGIGFAPDPSEVHLLQEISEAGTVIDWQRRSISLEEGSIDENRLPPVAALALQSLQGTVA